MIKLDDIDFSYEEKTIFKKLSLTLEKGKFYTLLGKNGSGKSTLLKLILGIEKPKNGEIYIDNINLRANLSECQKQIGMVFQNPDEQIVTDIIEEEIAFSMENYGLESKAMLKKIDELLLEIGFEGRNDEKVSKLSGGEKQRLCIASALALDPKILILDEATSMLDPHNRKIILTLLKKLKEKGMTIVLITHHLKEIEYCDEVLLLKNGEIDFKGPKELFNRLLTKGLIDIGLDLPVAFKVARDIYLRTEMDLSQDVFNLNKMGENLWKSL